MEPPRSFEHTPALSADVLPEAVRRAALELADSPGSGYVYDPALAADRVRTLRAALPDWARVYFAVKSNGFPPVLSHLARTVDGFEAASLSEARTALTALRERDQPEGPGEGPGAGSAPRERIAVSGPGKTPEMLLGLARLRAERGADVVVNVESELELHRAAAAARAADVVLPVTLRVNPERVPVSGSLVMGGAPSPFGLPEPRVPEAVAAAMSLPELDLVGFHVHAVSGNTDAVAHAAYVLWCLEWAAETAKRHGVDLRVVDVGGGLGVPFEEGDGEFDLTALGAALAALPDPGVEVVFEPGRWIAAPTGWYAARVTDVKSAYGEHFAVVRGGINQFQLPTSWEIRHNFAVVEGGDWPRDLPRPGVEGASVTVSGELCTPEDVLARDVRVGSLRAGDVLVFPNAGAYGHEFAMPAFLAHPGAPRRTVDTRATRAQT